MKIVLATKNQHKIKEILQIWGEIPFEVLTLYDFPDLPSIVENGKTFEENALKKAREIASLTGLLAVSDDSGLEVEGLGAAPGVYSARYAGEGASDQQNNEKLIHELKNFPLDDSARRAHFRCVSAVVDPQGFQAVSEGIIEGRILLAPRGENGFGYDPLFFVPHLGKTTAELSPEEKNQISHRGQAFRGLKEIILKKYF